MKRLKILSISSIMTAALTAGAPGFFAAFAQTDETIYPNDGEFSRTLVFSSLCDYATDGENYAFIDDGKLITVIDGEHRADYEISPVAVDCADGVFYYSDESGKVYELLSGTESQLTLQEKKSTVVIGDYIYYSLIDTTLKVTDAANDNIVTLEGAYSSMKRYGDSVYAVCENVLYKFDVAQRQAISLPYEDYSVTQSIKVGQTFDALKNYSPGFITVEKDCYVTEIDLAETEGEYFSVKGTQTFAEERTALLLCYTGNAAVFSIGDKAYVTLKSSVSEKSVDCYFQAEFGSATVTGTGIYASPYAIKGTAVTDTAWGTIVAVKQKLILDGVLSSAYYEVEYKDGEQTRTGYVAEGFLTEYIIEDNKDPIEVKDPDYSEENDVKKMALIFAVVVLVLAAIGYLTYIGTSGKSKKRKKNKNLPDNTEMN